MKKKLASLVGAILFVTLGIMVCNAQNMAVGETLYWDGEGTGADSYKVTWYPTADPTSVTSVDGIFEDRYKFEEAAFIENTQYTIEIMSVDCCGVESPSLLMKYYKRVGTGGDCCPVSIVKDPNSNCWVGVRGLSWFRPGGMINVGCN